MHLSRIAILVGAAAAAASLLLPQVRLPGLGEVNGIDGDAWPVLLLLAVPVLLALFGDRPRPNHPAAAVVVVAFGCLAFLFSLAKLVDATRAAQRVAGTVGVGAWVIPAAVLLVVGSGLYALIHATLAGTGGSVGGTRS